MKEDGGAISQAGREGILSAARVGCGDAQRGRGCIDSDGQLLKEIDADGINFDTLESVPPGFREASDAIGHPLALEPQFQPRDASLAWTNLSWNDWVTWEGKQYPFVPMVSKNKWMEPRHAVEYH